MTGHARKHPPPPVPRPSGPGRAPGVAQPLRTFDAIRTAGPGGGRISAGEELVRATQDLFQIRQADRGVMVRPNGTYNFVRVAGETRNRAQTLVSTKSGHAAIAGGKPVLYAGTIRFDNGALEWWSNYSGTYQPVAAFKQQAGLPEERFTPWQKLQMGGVGMQRGTFLDRRDVSRPDSAMRQPAPPATPGRNGPGKDGGGAAGSSGDQGPSVRPMGQRPAASATPVAAPTTTAGSAPSAQTRPISAPTPFSAPPSAPASASAGPSAAQTKRAGRLPPPPVRGR